MADEKVSALTELTTIDLDDLLLVIDDPAGTPVTKKIKVRNLVPYGLNNYLYKRLDSSDTGSNVNTAQPWFPTSGGVTLAASTPYRFHGILHFSRSAGSTSHTLDLLFGGTATLTAIDYIAGCKEGDTNAIADWDMIFGHAATALAVKAASTSTTENVLVTVDGIVQINAGGTFIPQFKFSAAPGGAPTIQPGTFFELWPMASAASLGTWS